MHTHIHSPTCTHACMPGDISCRQMWVIPEQTVDVYSRKSEARMAALAERTLWHTGLQSDTPGKIIPIPPSQFVDHGDDVVNLPSSEDTNSLPESPHDISESNAVSVHDGSNEPRRADRIARRSFQPKKKKSVGKWSRETEWVCPGMASLAIIVMIGGVTQIFSV